MTIKRWCRGSLKPLESKKKSKYSCKSHVWLKKKQWSSGTRISIKKRASCTISRQFQAEKTQGKDLKEVETATLDKDCLP